MPGRRVLRKPYSLSAFKDAYRFFNESKLSQFTKEAMRIAYSMGRAELQSLMRITECRGMTMPDGLGHPFSTVKGEDGVFATWYDALEMDGLYEDLT